MKIQIGKKSYKSEFNLGARLRIHKMGCDERTLLQECLQGDRMALAKFMYACLDKYDESFDKFCTVYPNTPLTDIMYLVCCQELIDEAINPYHLKTEQAIKREISDKHDDIKTDLQALLVHLMSLGYTQAQCLDMTNWDIENILEAQDLKLERECNIYSVCLNYIKAFMGVKGAPISILPKRDKKQNTSSMQKQIDIVNAMEKAMAETEKADKAGELNG
jgi:hypothetical protein